MPTIAQIYKTKFLAAQSKFMKNYSFLFNKVGTDVSKLVNNPAAKFVKAFNFAKIPEIDKQLEAIMATFREQSMTLNLRAIESSWQLANKKDDEIVNNYLKTIDNLQPNSAGAALLDTHGILYDKNIPALKAFIAKDMGTGTLSSQIWNSSVMLRKEMEIHLGLGLLNGDSAAKVSRRIRKYMQNPDALFKRVRNKKTGLLEPSKAMLAYHPGKGVYRSAYKNAMRVTRSETNMAYHLADSERWASMQMVIGIRIELSESHPDYKDPEICEILEGDYPKEFIFPGWHPQCLCHQVPIMMPKENFRKWLSGETTKIHPQKVKDYPENFKNYVAENGEKMAAMENPPYWNQMNKETISNITKE